MTAPAIGPTESVCPECLRRIPAERRREGDRVYLHKTCPDHGSFRVLIWDGLPDIGTWTNDRAASSPERCAAATDRGCPFDCGLCPEHRQQTCCVLLELTARCNLGCPICFASSGDAAAPDPGLDIVEGWYRVLAENGGHYNIQLSGGEPTLREDLPDIIRMGRRYGFDFFQLNTNGLRLVDRDYARRLADAGLSCVFLQFDGLDDGIFRTIRGASLLHAKLRAIECCAAAGLGVVLVPTVVEGVNDGALGELLRFAVDRLPAVRGVHFQPLSFFGRFPSAPPEERLTIPRMLRAIQDQTGGLMKVEHFAPPGGEHARCSFHGNFYLDETGALRPATRAARASCCCRPPSAADGMRKARSFVARQWSAPAPYRAPTATGDSLDRFIHRASRYALAVSGMLFQDAWSLDLERLRDCHIHVMSRDGSLVPFCAYNLSARDGRTLYRPGSAAKEAAI